MVTLSRREKQIFYLFAACLGLFVLDRIAITPLWDYWDQLNREVRRKQAEVNYDKQLLKDADRVRWEFSALGVSRRLSEAPNGENPVTGLLKEIERVARQNGLKIRNVRPQLAVASSGRQGGSVFVSVESGWEPFMRFLLIFKGRLKVSRSPKPPSPAPARTTPCSLANL
jgi:hypothetical protein